MSPPHPAQIAIALIAITSLIATGFFRHGKFEFKILISQCPNSDRFPGREKFEFNCPNSALFWGGGVNKSKTNFDGASFAKIPDFQKVTPPINYDPHVQ